MRERSPDYQFTVPVGAGQCVDVDQRLATLRAQIADWNRAIRAEPYAWRYPRRRWVLDIKYRGPRHGNRYDTPRWAATHADVYRRLRRDFN